MQRLSPKEKQVWEFICKFTQDNEFVPSYTEIKEHFGFASLFSVQRYIQQLSDKKYIQTGLSNQKRALQILKWPKDFTAHSEAEVNPQSILKTSGLKPKNNTKNPKNLDPHYTQLAFLGKVAAGAPLDFHLQNQFIDVPLALIKNFKNSYVVQISGNSMIELGILDNDYAIIQAQNHAENADIIVATIDGESTLKSFYQDNKREDNKKVELRPANHKLESKFMHPSDLRIEGKLIALFRKY